MTQLFNIVIKQILTIYIGGTILFLFYKLKGQEITYSQILNEINTKTGLKKYSYKAFYLGVGFLIVLVIILANFKTNI